MLKSGVSSSLKILVVGANGAAVGHVSWMLVVSMLLAFAATLMGGVFYAFSSFVMTALSNIESSEGIKAMQQVNIDVFCWSFSLLFFGLPVVFLGFAIYAFIYLPVVVAAIFIAGSMVYLMGSLLVMAVANVPLNNRLARLDPEADNACEVWQAYQVKWTGWNHVRVVACLGSSLIYFIACYVCWGYP
ncbi:MAG: DUF1772 domain-containing protein [Pseudomonadales bacterium]|nr:DUF1772 domain-containing protein [Pseudomonadales bacterium]